MKRRFFVPLIMVGLISGPVLAHTDEHTGHSSMAVTKEQMPWGVAGDADAVTRTVAIKMSDKMRFSPDRFDFKQGETVRFVFHNEGDLQHEYVLGTGPTLEAHSAMMAKHPTMQHEAPYMAHVAPGKYGNIIWTFNRAGDFDFACLINGHYQAGMVGKVHVSADSQKGM